MLGHNSVCRRDCGLIQARTNMSLQHHVVAQGSLGYLKCQFPTLVLQWKRHASIAFRNPLFQTRVAQVPVAKITQIEKVENEFLHEHIELT